MYISIYYKCLCTYVHVHVCPRLFNKAVSTSDLSSSPKVIKMIKPRSINLVGHVARTGKSERHRGVLWESQKEDLDEEWRIILK
jgi:hypothetical protein